MSYARLDDGVLAVPVVRGVVGATEFGRVEFCAGELVGTGFGEQRRYERWGSVWLGCAFENQWEFRRPGASAEPTAAAIGPRAGG